MCFQNALKFEKIKNKKIKILVIAPALIILYKLTTDYMGKVIITSKYIICDGVVNIISDEGNSIDMWREWETSGEKMPRKVETSTGEEWEVDEDGEYYP